MIPDVYCNLVPDYFLAITMHQTFIKPVLFSVSLSLLFEQYSFLTVLKVEGQVLGGTFRAYTYRLTSCSIG